MASQDASFNSSMTGGLVNRFSASSFPPMHRPAPQKKTIAKKKPVQKRQRQHQRGYAHDPMFESRRGGRSYSSDNLKSGNFNGKGANSTRTFYTHNKRKVHVVRRTASWSEIPLWPVDGIPKLCPLPEIPWNKVPGVLSQRGGTISPIHCEGHEPSPSNALPKGHDYVKRTQLITQVLFTEAARIHEPFGNCFHHSSTTTANMPSKVGPNIRTRLGVPDVVDVNLVLRPPVPAEAFEIVSTLPRDIEPGHAIARLNSSLSCAEKVNLKRTWAPMLLANEYLTPELVHQCLAEGIQKAIISLGKIHIARDLYSVIPAPISPPQMTIMASYINLDTDGDDSNSSFIINIFPIIVAAGIPRVSGFHLRMPMPRVLPFSRIGLEIMQEFDRDVQDWTLFWQLEARCMPDTKTVQNTKKQSESSLPDIMLTKRSQLKKEKREQDRIKPLPLEQHLRSWVISFEPLEERLLELCLKKSLFTKAKEAFSLFDDIVVEFSDEWSMFPPALTTSLKLWTLYKTAVKNRTILDWLMSLVMIVYESLKQKWCAYFLLPRINMLEQVQKQHVVSLRKHFHNLLNASSGQTRYKAKPASPAAISKLYRSNTLS